MSIVSERCDELLRLFLNNHSEEASSFNVEFLLDTLTCLYYECNLPQHRNERNCLKFCKTVKSLVDKIESCRLSRSEFETVRLIGSGAFGEVSLVKSKRSREIFALKSLHKYDMLKRSDRACFQEEREVLVKAMIRKSPWISQLHYTFQDEKYLYFVMKFYNGGDMLTMLSKFDDQIPENIAHFYLAELVLAIHSLHELGYVHRDIKPDNVLIESSGHIVLADFGSCLRIGAGGVIRNTTAIGTPDYIAPEILRAAEDSHGTFGVECDYWSLGVMMFEMLFGETPFYSENLLETYSNIMSFEKTFSVPEDVEEISPEARDLIKHFICDRKQRYGRNGIDEIIKHPFFREIDWENIRLQPAPYQPEVKSPEDTSNFDIEETPRTHEGPPIGSVFRGCQVGCIGFTFTKDSPLSQIGHLGTKLFSEGKPPVNLVSTEFNGSALPIPPPSNPPCLKCKDLNTRIQELEAELTSKPQKRPLAQSTVMATSPIAFTPQSQETQALQDELADVNKLHAETSEEMKKVQIQLGILEAKSLNDARKIDELSKTLIEAQDAIEKYRFDQREYEDENEELVKRAQDDRMRLAQVERENMELLSDLEEKRAELAIQRRLLDEQRQGDVQAKYTVDDNRQQQAVQLSPRRQHSSDELAEMKGKLREAVVWAKEAESKLINCEAYWTEQQTRWSHERADLQDRVHEIVKDRTYSLKCELEKERQNLTVMEQHLACWGARLVELNQMVDQEWVVKDKLHAAVLRLVADLQRLRNGSPELDYYDVHQTGVPAEDKLSLNGFIPSPNGGGEVNTLDWRQRKSTKMQKMEIANLQLALNNEVRERETALQQIRDLENQMEELSTRLRETLEKLVRTEKEKEALKDHLLTVTTEARRLRMKTADVETVIKSMKPELLNGHKTSLETPEDKASLRKDFVQPDANSLSISSFASGVMGVEGGGSSSSGQGHRLIPETFSGPIKCFVCSSLMLGQQWQGLRCKQCSFSCHLQCRLSAPSNCPDPADCSSTRPYSYGLDAVLGLGTILAGPVMTPKGDIKRGWVQQYAYLSDMRLFLFNCSPVTRARPIRNFVDVIGDSVQMAHSVDNLHLPKKISTASIASADADLSSRNVPPTPSPKVTYETDYDITSCNPTCIIDLHSPGFTVSHVTGADVIHAKSSSVPNILKIEPDHHLGAAPIFLLFNTSGECEQWFSILDENAKMLSRNFAHPDLQLQEISSASFPLAKHILSACVLDENRILLGAEDGLYTVDLRYKMYARVGEKKPIYQVEALPEELQLVAVIQDKQRRLCLVLLGAIEGMNYDRIRVAEPKRCTMFVTGWSADHSNYLICAAGQTSVWIYEVVRVPSRHHRIREIPSQVSTPDGRLATVQSVNIVRDGDWLAVGYPSSVILYNILEEGAITILLNPASIDLDSSLLMFRQEAYEAQLVIPLNYEEFLLIFEHCGVYVNSQRECTRPYHLYWPAKPFPHGFTFRAPDLYCFTEIGLFVFDVVMGAWQTSLTGRRLQPLTGDGHLCSLQPVRPLDTLNGIPASFSSQASIPVSLVYIPPPLAPISSLRRNLRLQNNEPRILDLSTVIPLNSTARVRKSRRFSWLSRHNGSMPPDSASVRKSCEQLSEFGNSSATTTATKPPSVFTKARSATMFSSVGANSRKLLSSRLISGPSDFRHVKHGGPVVNVSQIDLTSKSHQEGERMDPEYISAVPGRYSMGNYSCSPESGSVKGGVSGSLHSAQSLENNSGQSTNHSASSSSQLSVDPMPSPQKPHEAELTDPRCNVSPELDLLTLSSDALPGFRDEVMALFSTFGTNESSPRTPQRSAPDELQTPTNPDSKSWAS